MRHEVPSQGTHPGLLPQLPSFSVQFPDETLRSGELLNMIVAVIDSAQVHKGLASREAWAAGHPPPPPHVCALQAWGLEGKWIPGRQAGLILSCTLQFHMEREDENAQAIDLPTMCRAPGGCSFACALFSC